MLVLPYSGTERVTYSSIVRDNIFCRQTTFNWNFVQIGIRFVKLLKRYEMTFVVHPKLLFESTLTGNLPFKPAVELGVKTFGKVTQFDKNQRQSC